MAETISKEEMELIKQHRKEKANTHKVEVDATEPEPLEIDTTDLVTETEDKPKEEPYACGSCGTTVTKSMTHCPNPQCKAKLEW